MEKEILFRGKQKKDGNWIYGYYVVTPENDHRIYWQPFPSATSNTWHEVIPETVGQLWIKSGKRLFGGDLFKATCSISGKLKRSINICKVCDSDSGFEVVIWHENEWWHYNSMDFTSMELIGNIHDNPELLK